MTIGVYGLRCPLTSKMMYVGSSINIERRYQSAHLSTSGSLAKVKWMMDLRRQGLKPELVILERCEAEGREDRELVYIMSFRKLGQAQFNVKGTKLGEGTSPYQRVRRRNLQLERLLKDAKAQISAIQATLVTLKRSISDISDV